MISSFFHFSIPLSLSDWICSPSINIHDLALGASSISLSDYLSRKNLRYTVPIQAPSGVSSHRLQRVCLKQLKNDLPDSLHPSCAVGPEKQWTMFSSYLVLMKMSFHWSTSSIAWKQKSITICELTRKIMSENIRRSRLSLVSYEVVESIDLRLLALFFSFFIVSSVCVRPALHSIRLHLVFSLEYALLDRRD